jgi:hypothetical protein
MLGNQDGFEDGTVITEYLEEYKTNDVSKNLVIYSDVANTIFFFLFIITFKYVCAFAQKKVLKSTQTVADYTIYAVGLPEEDATEADVIEHFAQYGKVVEVIFARKIGRMMKAYK